MLCLMPGVLVFWQALRSGIAGDLDLNGDQFHLYRRGVCTVWLPAQHSRRPSSPRQNVSGFSFCSLRRYHGFF